MHLRVVVVAEEAPDVVVRLTTTPPAAWSPRAAGAAGAFEKFERATRGKTRVLASRRDADCAAGESSDEKGISKRARNANIEFYY